MNTKTAKALRKETNHHRTVPFQYLTPFSMQKKINGKMETLPSPTVIVDPSSTKGQYKAAKKAFKNA